MIKTYMITVIKTVFLSIIMGYFGFKIHGVINEHRVNHCKAAGWKFVEDHFFVVEDENGRKVKEQLYAQISNNCISDTSKIRKKYGL